MALFRRNKTNKVALPELEKYYDAERRERSGLAWILALVSIAAVVLVLIGLFFGGRMIYRNLTDDKKPVVTVQTKDKADKTKNDTNGKTKNDTEVKPSAPPSTPAPTNTPATPSSNAAPTPAAPVAATPATRAPATGLSDTGPESVLPYFLIATIIGTLGYRLKFRTN